MISSVYVISPAITPYNPFICFQTFGPLIPTADYTLLKSFIVSIACYAGIALITTFCVFPETMSHSVLRTVCEQLERVEKAVGMQTEVFDVVQTGEDGIAQLAPGKPLPAKLDGLKALMVAVMRQSQSLTRFFLLCAYNLPNSFCQYRPDLP